jgi:exodeoxyribonuclease III
MEPAAKRQRADPPIACDPQSIVCLNLDGLKARVLAKEKERGVTTAVNLARNHAHALVAHLCSVTGTGAPDVVFFSEVQLRGRSKERQGELQQLGVGNAADKEKAKSAHDAWSTLTSCPALSGYTFHRSLHATAGASGVAVFLRPDVVPLSVRFSLDPEAPQGAHHPEGRVVLLEFTTLRLLLTYSPNSGKTQDSFQRRADFDAQILALVSASSGKPLIWAGDLNVSPTEQDYTEGIRSRNLPGTTAVEKERFARILADGKMRDAWRSLHPGVEGGWTWRGGAFLPGQKMRLDHFVISEALWSRVRRVEAVEPAAGGALITRGPLNEHPAHYFGSDHWPLFLELSPPPAPEDAANAEQE